MRYLFLALVLAACGGDAWHSTHTNDAGTRRADAAADASQDATADATPDAPPCMMDASALDVHSACKDVIYALCDKIAGCGLAPSFGDCFAQFQTRVCNHAVALRDRCQLPSCVAYAMQLDCATLESPFFAIDPSCAMQFIEGN